MIHCLAPVIRPSGRRACASRRRPSPSPDSVSANAGELLAGGQRRHALGRSVRRAVVEDRQRAGARVHGDGHADAGVGARELLEHEHVGEEVRARAAVLLGHADAHQPELAQLAEQLAREVVVAVPLGRVRRDPLVGEAPREVADLALVVGELVRAHRRRTAPARAPSPAAQPTARPPPRRAAAAASQTFEPHDLPALLARHARQLRVRIDGDGMADEPQHRQVGLRVRVRPGGGEVDALALGQLADRLRPCPRGS